MSLLLQWHIITVALCYTGYITKDLHGHLTLIQLIAESLRYFIYHMMMIHIRVAE
jgi:hypothetical protein